MNKIKHVFFLTLTLFLVSCTTCEEFGEQTPNGLSVIIIQDGFSHEEFMTKAEYIKESILAKEPFKSKPHINFRIIPTTTKICKEGIPLPVINNGEEIIDVGTLAPLDCDIQEIKQLANTCRVKKAKLIIATNETVISQTSITYDESGVMFLDMKNQPPEIIQHEFTHFFGLVDEKAVIYSHANGPGRETAPNCVATLEEANNWNIFYGENHTYPKGCAGSTQAYKPETQTLLSEFPEPTWNYGTFNTWYLGRVMDCCYSSQENECRNFFASYPQWEGCRE